MMSLSAAILVATCTATFGLHSSSSTTSSYSYFAFESALRSFTARSAELRPPIPLTATPPVSGPMKPTFTLSLAFAAPAASVSAAATSPAVTTLPVLIIDPSLFRYSTAAAASRHPGYGRAAKAVGQAYKEHLRGAQRRRPIRSGHGRGLPPRAKMAYPDLMPVGEY